MIATSRQTTRLPLLPALDFVVGALLIAFLTLFHEEITAGPRRAAIVASAVLVIVVLLQRSVIRKRGLTVGLTYLLLLGVFHCGLLLTYAVNGSVTLLNSRDTAWLWSSGLPEAAWVSALGVAAFGTGYALLSGRAAPAGAPSERGPMSDSTSENMGIVGLLAFGAGLAGWLFWTIASGAFALGGSYIEFLSRTADKPMPFTYLAMGLGLPMTAGASRTVRRVGLGLFVLWAGPAFLIGLRGEVILPLAAYLVVAARHRRLPLAGMAVGGFTLLCLGAFVRGFRTAGLNNGAIEWRAFNPIDGLAELGYSIRPVVTALGWRVTGEPPVGMDTYLNPVRRLLSPVVQTDTPTVVQDPSALSTTVSGRIGPIGGSSIAEAYRVQGAFSVIVVLLLVGLTCRVLDSLPVTETWDALVGGSAFILFLWIRNDFVPVPAQILLMLFVVGLASLLPSKPSGRPAAVRGLAEQGR